MLLQIAGYLWIVSGGLMTVFPRASVQRLRRKGMRRLRRLLVVVGIALSASLISLARELEGVASTAVVITGIIGIIKSFAMLKSAAAERLLDWAGRIPANVIRIGGIIYVAIGAGCLYLAQRAA